MYLDEVFIKHLDLYCTKKDLLCVFAFLGKLSLKIKKQLQNAIERTLPYLHLKLSTIFILKICLLKNSPLALFSFKCNSYFYVRAAEHKEIWQKNVLKMLSNQLFQITC